jgi:signal transduction histidine kinase
VSLRLRLALMSGIATFVVAALFGTAVYLVTSERLYASLDDSLDQYALQINRRMDRPTTTQPSLQRLLGDNATEFAIAYSADGQELGRSLNGTGIPVTLSTTARDAALQGRTTSMTVSRGGTRYRLHVVPLPPGASTPVAATGVRMVTIGGNQQALDSTLANLRLILIAAAPITLLLGLALAWFVAGRGLQPVRELTKAAERLGTDDLRRRLPTSARRDELAGLTEAFNASLARLEDTYTALQQALDQQQQFVTDASHELRTPLTVILNNAQTLIDHPEASPGDRAECMQELVDEANRLVRLSSDLLHLASSEVEQGMEEVEWDTLVEDAGRDAVAICAPRPVKVETQGRLGWGTANRAVLRQTFRAFFDNIARHTPETAGVALHAHQDGGWIWISVADTGQGVPAEALARIFDRFYRADRSRHGEGSGLGLAIGRTTIESHGGQIVAANRPQGGFQIDVKLPRYLKAEPSSEEQPASASGSPARATSAARTAPMRAPLGQ